MRVAVLYGGISAEREVSLVVRRRRSSPRLREAGFDVTPIEVGDDLGALLAALEPAAGRGVQRAARALRRGRRDPGRARLARHSLHAFRRARLGAGDGQDGGQGRVRRRRPAGARAAAWSASRSWRTADPLPLPYVVKPVNEGSSVGVEIIRCGDNRRADVARAWRFGPAAMVEEYIPGRELTVGVMGERALAVTEIIAEAGSFYDYDSKYARRRLAPRDPGRACIRTPMRARCDMALAAHRALGCRGATRADFRYDDTARRTRPARAAGGQHAARPDADLAAAGTGGASRHRVSRALRLDGGAGACRAGEAAAPAAQFDQRPAGPAAAAAAPAALDCCVRPAWGGFAVLVRAGRRASLLRSAAPGGGLDRLRERPCGDATARPACGSATS